MSFATLKKNSNSSFEKLTRELEKVASTEKNTGDDRLWKPELDKSGNGYAVIRFLPPPEGEELPGAKVFSHALQGPGAVSYTHLRANETKATLVCPLQR